LEEVHLKRWTNQPTSQPTNHRDGCCTPLDVKVTGWLDMKRPGDDVHVVTTAKRKPRIITHVQKAKGKIKWERKKRGYAPMYLCVLLLLDCIHVYIYLRNYYRLWSPAGRCATVVSSLVVSFSFLFFSPRQSRLPCVVVVVVGTARPLSVLCVYRVT
jgi:hypothetical protein